ncbi:Putative ribonuclease H protein At1g65750 [Linum perenne]
MLVGSRAAIRDGCYTLMWSTRWVDAGVQLGDWLREDGDLPNLEDKVANFVTTDGQWDVDRLTRILKPEAVEMVIGMSTPRPGRGEDLCVGWIRFFLWLASHERLLMKSLCRRRNMTDDGTCGHFLQGEETVGYALRDCSFARTVWVQLGLFDLNGVAWNRNTVSWLNHQLQGKQTLAFGVSCWQIWKARNERDKAFGLISNIREECLLAWEPGPIGWLTLNSDGSVDPRSHKAAAGGLLRDNEGYCIFAYTMNLGACSITRVEMRGAIQGLEYAWVKGYRKISLKMDLSAAIALLTNTEVTEH